MRSKKIGTIFIVYIMYLFVCYPERCMQGASSGLLLWFNKVLPSLLPFIILTNMLCELDSISFVNKKVSPITTKLLHIPAGTFLALLMSFIGGYPMGAKVIQNLISTKQLSFSEAQKALCFCNNCSILFIIGTVGNGMLHNVGCGYFLAVIHILSALTLCIIFKLFHTTSTATSSSLIHKNVSFTEVFNESIKNGMDTIVYIGGYIIFFSVLITFVHKAQITKHLLYLSNCYHLCPQSVLSVITGILELSNGIASIASLQNLSLQTLSLIAFILGFGGLCVHFQTSYVLGQQPLYFSFYLISKLLHGLLSVGFCYLLYPLFSVYTLKTNFIFSFKPFILFSTVLLFCITIVYMLNFLYHHPNINLNNKIKNLI